jgi:hypothetical protein
VAEENKNGESIATSELLAELISEIRLLRAVMERIAVPAPAEERLAS